ncbi:hypothetical protein PMN64_00505 [Bradyrhizobium sp. UFLA01-814]|uniref:hypothetical protein n=1 Tax=Bradyrhizobium sp. UFLA01-814 TaxID=3023480 RepID=UPI00398A5220
MTAADQEVLVNALRRDAGIDLFVIPTKLPRECEHSGIEGDRIPRRREAEQVVRLRQEFEQTID